MGTVLLRGIQCASRIQNPKSPIRNSGAVSAAFQSSAESVPPITIWGECGPQGRKVPDSRWRLVFWPSSPSREAAVTNLNNPVDALLLLLISFLIKLQDLLQFFGFHPRLPAVPVGRENALGDARFELLGFRQELVIKVFSRPRRSRATGYSRAPSWQSPCARVDPGDATTRNTSIRFSRRKECASACRPRRASP